MSDGQQVNIYLASLCTGHHTEVTVCPGAGTPEEDHVDAVEGAGPDCQGLICAGGSLVLAGYV